MAEGCGEPVMTASATCLTDMLLIILDQVTSAI
jgi:hypothetical protein